MDYVILVATIVGTLSLLIAGLLIVKGAWSRSMLAGPVFGLLIYSGIGAASKAVPHYFVGFYFVLLLAFVYSNVLTHFLFTQLRFVTTMRLRKVLWSVDVRRVWTLAACAYVVLHFIPLIYPEIRISLLFSPPVPKAFTITWKEQASRDIILEILRYLIILGTPFYLISLYRLRKRPLTLFLLLLLPVYFSYLDVSYIGRANALTPVVILFGILWIANPKWRLGLTVVVVALMPLIIGILGSYVQLRLGQKVALIGNIWEALSYVFSSETNFPARNAIPVIQSGKNVDLVHFFNWAVTLPVPGPLLEGFPRSYLNAEMSEIILGIPRTSARFYGVLPGLVGESVYIYGRYFYWVHGLFLGALASFFTSIIGRAPQVLPVRFFVFILLTYNLNRGGIAAVLPILVNSFLLYFVLVFISVFPIHNRIRSDRRHCLTI